MTTSEFDTILDACVNELINIENVQITVGDLNSIGPLSEIVLVRGDDRSPIEFDGHFRPEVPLIVFDQRLGTIGLFVPLPESASVERAPVLTAIEQAAYLRHLCLVKAAQAEPPEQAWTVELVLLLEAAQTGAVQSALGTVLRDSEYLYGIGVHLLPITRSQDAEDDAPTLAEKNRAAIADACCWLLVQTRAWFALAPVASNPGASNPVDPTASAPKPRPRTLTLENWRLPGRRILPFAAARADQACVQLIHGPNGSGKSSLVEALELLATGKISRLPERADVKDILKNIKAESPARVSLSVEKNSEVSLEWKSDSENPPEALMSPVLAFSLNQPAMNDFTEHATAERRVSLLLSGFFPEYQNIIENPKLELRILNNLLSSLPKWVVRQFKLVTGYVEVSHNTSRVRLNLIDFNIKHSEIIKEFLARNRGTVSDDFQPFSPEEQQTLLKYLADLSLTPVSPLPSEEIFTPSVADPDSSTLTDACNTFDAPWRDLSARLNNAHADIGRALRLLAEPRFQAWRPQAAAGQARSPLALLKAWVEAETMQRLLHRHWVNTSALATQAAPWPEEFAAYEAALGDVWQAARADSDGRERATLKQLRDQARQQAGALRTAWETPSSGDGDGGATAPPPRLTEADRRCLDALSDLLAIPAEQPRLGQALHRALSDGQVSALGPYVLGGENWTAPLLERLGKLQEICTALDGAVMEPATTWLAVLRYVRQGDRYIAAQQKVTEAFNREIGKLYQGPLHEFILACTPARWAYPSIDGKIETEDDQHSLHICFGDKKDGELRLNTAELNIFVVALFLLCAPKRADNPWRLLVLDDPLQNMDELTVTSLARNIARVARLLDPSWLLLMLFHGADDFARMAVEIPAPTLSLPWQRSVAPDGAPDDELKLTAAPTKLARLEPWVRRLLPGGAPAG